MNHIRLFLLSTIAVAQLFSCGHHASSEISAKGENPWRKGDSVWYFVSTSDSVFSNDSLESVKRRTKLVKLTLLGVDPMDSIEWQEYFDFAEGDMNQSSEPQWIPSMKLLYSINAEGDVMKWLNFDEIRLLADSIAAVSLEGLSSDTVAAIRSVVMDSSSMASRLLAQPNLLHAHLRVMGGHDSTAGVRLSMSEQYLPWLHRSELSRCDAPWNVSISGYLKVDSVDIREATNNAILQRAMNSLGIQPMTLTVTMDCCIDTVRAWPEYLTHSVRFEQPGVTAIKSTYVTLRP
jgi:hypothetical protein